MTMAMGIGMGMGILGFSLLAIARVLLLLDLLVQVK